MGAATIISQRKDFAHTLGWSLGAYRKSLMNICAKVGQINQCIVRKLWINGPFRQTRHRSIRPQNAATAVIFGMNFSLIILNNWCEFEENRRKKIFQCRPNFTLHRRCRCILKSVDRKTRDATLILCRYSQWVTKSTQYYSEHCQCRRCLLNKMYSLKTLRNVKKLPPPRWYCKMWGPLQLFHSAKTLHILLGGH